MRLTTVLLIATIMQVSAAGFAQKVTLSVKKAPLKDVFRELGKQSKYDFLYTNQLLKNAKPVDVQVDAADLKDVLELIFRNQPLTYVIDEKTVVIKEKEQSFLDNIIARFQAIDVRGKVVDSLGNGLAGATVSVKNGRGSTSTDAGGNFQLKNVDEGAVLVVNYLGYVTRELAVNKEFMNVVLQQSESKLDEIKIVAYGTTTQRLSTGNTVSIKANEIGRQYVSDPLLALQGRVAGLQIVPASGIDGAPLNIRLRGQNSLNFSQPPLIVVDGLPIQSNITGMGSTLYDSNRISAISFLNPSDIESINVLKDADATSIYGSRGANGVILIETKKGNQSNSGVAIDLQTSISSMPKSVDMMATQDYIDLRKEAFANGGIDINSLPITTQTADIRMWDRNRNTNWQDELLGGSSTTTLLNASAMGGSQFLSYNISGNFNRKNSIFSKDLYHQRGSGRVSLSGKSPNGKFQTGVTVNYVHDFNSLPNADLTRQSLALAPNAPNLFTPIGDLNWEPLPSGAASWANPVWEVKRNYLGRASNFITSAQVSYALMPSLTIKSLFSYNILAGKSFVADFPFKYRRPDFMNRPGRANFFLTESANTSFEPQIEFKPLTGRNQLTILLGGSIQATDNSSEEQRGTGFTSDALLMNKQSATSLAVTNASNEYRYSAAFARLSLTRDNRYLLNISARRDGSSRFGPENRFGNFASFGLGWIFSEENLFKNNSSIFSFGKIRGSYGTSGNDGIGDYNYFERYSPTPFTYQSVIGYSTSGIFNSNYAWETTRKLEFGLETGWFKNSILFNIVYYRNRTNNLLVSYPYPSFVGPGSAFVNLGATIENSGYEGVLTAGLITTDNFKWSASLNISLERNQLVSYPDFEKSPYSSSLEIGQPFFGNVSVYKFAGVNSQTGLYQFETIDGKIVADPTDQSMPQQGRFKTINLLPKFYGGFSNSLSYQGFQIDIDIQFRKQMAINPMADYLFPGLTSENVPSEYADRWHTPGDQAKYAKVTSNPDVDFYNSANFFSSSDGRYADASFIRFKTISLSYGLTPRFAKYIGIDRIRITALAQNLITLTKYKGLDPEILNNYSLPQLKTFSFGLNLQF